MKNNPMNRLLIPTLSAVLTLILLCTCLPAVAQQADGSDSIPRHRKAWEIGVGIHGLQLTRFNVTGFSPGSNGGYRIDTDKRDVLFGGHLYLARELNSHFFLDLQGNADFTADPVRGGKEKRWTAMAGMGLQWRLGEYFRSPYIDPFLRAGANYLYKNFTVGYNGLERLNAEEMKWDLANDFDKEGSDRRHLLPLSVGAGVNLWLNDRLGLGLQADYLVMPYRRVANAWQGNVRLLWRIGGKRKRPAPEVRYVDRIAHILCADTSRHYLITGCTDARGSLAYNAALSERRARAVVQALTERGVPAQMLKACGVSKKIAHAAPENFFENGTRSFFSRVRRDAFASPCVSIPILRASYGRVRTLVATCPCSPLDRRAGGDTDTKRLWRELCLQLGVRARCRRQGGAPSAAQGRQRAGLGVEHREQAGELGRQVLLVPQRTGVCLCA